MSHLTLSQILVLNLEGKIPPERTRQYLTKEKALEELRHRTGQDFGYDVDAWKRWFKTHSRF
jgi:hypothetical protein